MFRIIDGRGTGKTSHLILLAKEYGATVVCSNPSAMEVKARNYGIVGVDFISYSQYLQTTPGRKSGKKYMIDELDAFLDYMFHNSEILGYTISLE